MIRNSKGMCRLVASFLVLVLGSTASTVALASDGNIFRDPAKFSDWEVVGPNGGDVRTVAIDPRDKNRLYISTMDGQIHTSADGGKRWTLLATLDQPQL